MDSPHNGAGLDLRPPRVSPCPHMRIGRGASPASRRQHPSALFRPCHKQLRQPPGPEDMDSPHSSAGLDLRPPLCVSPSDRLQCAQPGGHSCAALAPHSHAHRPRPPPAYGRRCSRRSFAADGAARPTHTQGHKDSPRPAQYRISKAGVRMCPRPQRTRMPRRHATPRRRKRRRARGRCRASPPLTAAARRRPGCRGAAWSSWASSNRQSPWGSIR